MAEPKVVILRYAEDHELPQMVGVISEARTELARLAARVEELEFGAHGVTADELRAEIKRLREALRFYADPEGGAE
jgi:hypothetical protein